MALAFSMQAEISTTNGKVAPCIHFYLYNSCYI